MEDFTVSWDIINPENQAAIIATYAYATRCNVNIIERIFNQANPAVIIGERPDGSIYIKVSPKNLPALRVEFKKILHVKKTWIFNLD